MTTFTFDTSGAVNVPNYEPDEGWSFIPTGWAHLEPFQQGYTTALLLSLYDAEEDTGPPYGFSDLSPEALSMILADCAAAGPGEPRAFNADGLRRMGAQFWKNRQSGAFPDFPPQTVSLSEDGKVKLEVEG